MFDSRNPQPLGNVPSLEQKPGLRAGDGGQPVSQIEKDGLWCVGQAGVGAWDLGRAA